MATKLDELRKVYDDVTEETREAYDKLFPPFGDDRENIDKNYKKAIRENDKEEIARLKPVWDAASAAYKQAQTRKNAINLQIKRLERKEKERKLNKAEENAASGTYKKALARLNEAEATINSLKGPEEYNAAYLAAQDAYNSLVEKGKTPSSPLPKPIKNITPRTIEEDEDKTGGTEDEGSTILESTSAIYDTLVDPKNQAQLKATQQNLLKNFPSIYKGKADGINSWVATQAAIERIYTSRGLLPKALQGANLMEFIAAPVIPNLFSSGSGVGAELTDYGIIASPSVAKGAINQVFQAELQRDATEEELKKLIPNLIAAQKANPNRVKMVKGVRQTTQGLDVGQWIVDRVQKLPEYAQRKEDKTIPSLQILQETARNNGLTLLPSQVESYKLRLQNGEKVETIQSNIRAIAANAMPDNVKKLLDAGSDLTEVYQPYRQSMATILEIPMDKIDLSDPTLTNAITDKGNMTLFDFKKSLRKDPRWQYTENARETVSSGLTQVLKDFGFMG
jgi:hypothetical protein